MPRLIVVADGGKRETVAELDAPKRLLDQGNTSETVAFMERLARAILDAHEVEVSPRRKSRRLAVVLPGRGGLVAAHIEAPPDDSGGA